MRWEIAFFPSVLGLGCRSPREAVQPAWFYLGEQESGSSLKIHFRKKRDEKSLSLPAGNAAAAPRSPLRGKSAPTSAGAFQEPSPLCSQVFAPILPREAGRCPSGRGTLGQSKRAVSEAAITRPNGTNRVADACCQHLWRESNNFKVLLDVSLMKLFSAALNLLQKSQSF